MVKQQNLEKIARLFKEISNSYAKNHFTCKDFKFSLAFNPRYTTNNELIACVLGADARIWEKLKRQEEIVGKNNKNSLLLP